MPKISGMEIREREREQEILLWQQAIYLLLQLLISFIDSISAISRIHQQNYAVKCGFLSGNFRVAFKI